MNKKTVRDVDLADKRVIMRVDFNVPLTEAGQVANDARIVASLPTIRYILEKGASLVLMSHLGRPKGKLEPKYSLAPTAARLSQLLGRPVRMLADCVGPEVEAACRALKPGEVALLENLRFHKEEEANEPGFCRALAGLADVYVNDAFGTAHRAHASTEGITRFVPVAVAGFLMEKEIEYLCKALDRPKRPFVAIMGGAKISGKIDVITNLLPKVDVLLVGGGMTYTLMQAQGQGVGDSLVEADKLEVAREVLAKAGKSAARFVLPVDHVVAAELAPGVAWKVVEGAIPAGMKGLDIGPKTVEQYVGIIKSAGTVVWNGPMGVFETPPFDAGTRAVAEALAASSATSIVGGGDSVAAVEVCGVADKISHVSTGGGASLELLEGRTLPGLVALNDA
ncbi:phosphoglycerate kinase [bacterium]|nr:phosphoglycerate kinase [bacterium]